MSDGQNLHATTAVLGESGVLIRGASGAGKTALALALVDQVRSSGAFARLVADDRTLVTRRGDRLVARPHPALAGRAERRGLGIVAVEHEPACVLGLVVDLVEGRPERHPAPDALRCAIAGVVLPRVSLPAGPPSLDAIALVRTALVRAALPGVAP
ncbi:HPr kinase/phosphorylase [Lichenibacterium dinghuense]|uniref:HPr kinase/phosphorylase n=1 Tax=Lichenibacterium dinghuense TaxID=2895977 RepID=UPI001F207A9A|nr:hypothetical protein [Lichenibacterium sp. 6Y81]